jgi:hypothetical protein
MVLGVACEKSRELNASQHADKALFRNGNQRPEREKESGRAASTARWWNPQDMRCFSRWHELGSQGRRTLTIVLDNENGDVIVNVITARICCGVIDIDPEVLRGE